MADGSQPVYGAMSNEQIALEGMVQGLDDYAAVGRLEAIRRLERLEGSLPEGAIKRLLELAGGDPDGSGHVLLAARRLLRKHGVDPGPLP
jgi:hypothetical protein